MRQHLFVLFFSTAIAALPPTDVQAYPLEDCLQSRLDRVLAGDNVASHTNILGLTELALGGANWQKIVDNPEAVARFTKTIIAVIEARIGERGKEFIGATLKLIPSNDTYTAEGVIITSAGTYNISVTFPDQQSCLVNDISIHGAFMLRRWVADQPEVQTLMKTYKLKR